MANLPEAGLCLARPEYAQELIYQVIAEKVKTLGIPPEVAEGPIREAVQDLYYNRDIFIVKAIDDPHAEYVQAILQEYATKPDVKYVLTMRCFKGNESPKKPKQPQPYDPNSHAGTYNTVVPQQQPPQTPPPPQPAAAPTGGFEDIAEGELPTRE